MRTTVSVSGRTIPPLVAGLYLRLIVRIVAFYGHPPLPPAMRAVDPAWDVARIRASVKPTAVRIAKQERTAITLEFADERARYELRCERDPARAPSDRLRFTSLRYRMLTYEWVRVGDGVVPVGN